MHASKYKQIHVRDLDLHNIMAHPLQNVAIFTACMEGELYISISACRLKATIKVNTPSLGGKDKKPEMFTKGRVVLMGPDSRFEETNPEIMQCLTEVFGKNVWKHYSLHVQ